MGEREIDHRGNPWRPILEPNMLAAVPSPRTTQRVAEAWPASTRSRWTLSAISFAHFGRQSSTGSAPGLCSVGETASEAT
jgi:hypothetical protein